MVYPREQKKFRKWNKIQEKVLCFNWFVLVTNYSSTVYMQTESLRKVNAFGGECSLSINS